MAPPVARMRRLRVVQRSEAPILAVLTVFAVAFEAFGVAMLFPVLDFINSGKDAVVLAEQSRLWAVIVDSFALVALDVTLLTLCATVFVLIVMRQLLVFTRTLTMERIRARISRDLQRRCFSKVMSSTGLFIQDIGAGAFAYLVNVQCDSAASLVRNLVRFWSNIIPSPATRQ